MNSDLPTPPPVERPPENPGPPGSDSAGPGPGGTDFTRRKQNTLWTLIGVSLVLGVVDVGLGASLTEAARFGIALLGNLALLVIAFHWLNLDSHELGIHRPVWLNIGIVLLLIVFVPYYLYKTRPEGKRAPVLLGFLAVLVACVFASAIGSALAAATIGTPAPTAS